MAYVMAVVYQLEGDQPLETLEEFIKTLPENALYFTNPLVMPDFDEAEFEALVSYCTPDTGRWEEARSILEVMQRTWVYSTQFIAQSLGLTENEVLDILEKSQ